MINFAENRTINARLREEYAAVTTAYLAEWAAAFPDEQPPKRINEFGIIDESRYDTDNGILFIGRETNGWSNTDYVQNCLFRSWMEDISRHGLDGHGHIRRHPTMWYNIGRWATLIDSPDTPTEVLAEMKASAIRAIGGIAFTNVNKVRGYAVSRKGYTQLAHSAVAGEILTREIEILRPRTIVCCGTCRPVLKLIPAYTGQVLLMPHPGARRRAADMLEDLRKQIPTHE